MQVFLSFNEPARAVPLLTINNNFGTQQSDVCSSKSHLVHSSSMVRIFTHALITTASLSESVERLSPYYILIRLSEVRVY